jgi:hemolysin A
LDRAHIFRASGGDDVICGVSEYDAANGGGGNDQLFGDKGDNRLDNGEGFDHRDGGSHKNAD